MTTKNKKGNEIVVTVERDHSPVNRKITVLMKQTGHSMFDYYRVRSAAIAAAERADSPSSDGNDPHGDEHRDPRPTPSKL